MSDAIKFWIAKDIAEVAGFVIGCVFVGLMAYGLTVYQDREDRKRDERERSRP